MERLLNVKELSKILSIKESTIYDWVSIGFIPHHKLGKLVRFKESEILQWLDKKRNNGRVKRIPEITTFRN